MKTAGHQMALVKLTAILIYNLSVNSLLIGCVEISFESGHSAGFFVKSGHEETTDATSGTLLNRDRFIVLQPSRSTMVQVNYGPFTAKQTVPYPSSLPLVSLNSSADMYSRWPASTDVTAYLVTKELRREQPVLRVLFHFTQSGRRTGDLTSSGSNGGGSDHNYQNLCVILIATTRDPGHRRIGVCSPTNRETTCLAEVIVPHSWWPPLRRTAAGPKAQKNVVNVEYAVAVDLKRSECDVSRVGPSFAASNPPTTTITTTTSLWHVPVSPDPVRYSEMVENGSAQVLVPRNPVYARSKVHIPVFVRTADVHAVNVFVMRARVKSGLKILEAEATMSDYWTITVDLNLKRTVATVTAFAKDRNEDNASTSQPKFDDDYVEAFAWLLEVDENGESVERPPRITWTMRYVREAGISAASVVDQSSDIHHEDSMKMTTELDVHKDEIQSVLLVSKTWELVNTAMLNGKQVSQPVKVFIVSQAGKVADVTLQSSCHSIDESILKVSPSCTSVYLDGSEIRGSYNVSVTVKYGTYTGIAQFTIWVPELPLDIHVEDQRLSQIRNWKAPKEYPRKLIPRSRGPRTDMSIVQDERRRQRQIVCRLRYQQTPVDVYARFIAVDDKSGRESYLLNRKSSFRVTDLVDDHLRIADPRIATLTGRVVQGHSVGRTEVQILSPITGRVIGASELRVLKDKETVTGLKVDVVTGLQLSIKADYDVAKGFIAETTVTHRLTAQYQEGVLDVDVLFSDGTRTPLSQVPESEFILFAETSDSHVVDVAPRTLPHHPRVIALYEGNVTLRLVLTTPDVCSKNSVHRAGTRTLNEHEHDHESPLASASAVVFSHVKDVQRSRTASEKSSVQNDERGKLISRVAPFQRPSSIDSSVQLDAHYGRDNSGPLVEARQNPSSFGHHSLTGAMLSLDFGMYALLGIFCLAISVFVASCTVYAVRFHKKQVAGIIGRGGGGGGGCQSSHGYKNDAVSSAHDWVWLGRATLERKSVGTQQCRLAQQLLPPPPPPLPLPQPQPPAAAAAKGVPNFEMVSVINENAFDLNAAAASEADSRPPTPPLRRARVTENPIASTPLRTFRTVNVTANRSCSDGSVAPPPVPPHGIPLAPIRQRQIPQHLALNPLWPSNDENDGYNYNLLLEYFDNLKESNA